MKLFLWKFLDHVSYRWHSDGGLVIVAESLAAAKSLASKDEDIIIDKEPDYIYEVAGQPDQQIFVFRNAGCC